MISIQGMSIDFGGPNNDLIIFNNDTIIERLWHIQLSANITIIPITLTEEWVGGAIFFRLSPSNSFE